MLVIGQRVCTCQAFPAKSTPGAYPRVEHFKGASRRNAPNSLKNIRLGRTGLPVTNTLAYYLHYGSKRQGPSFATVHSVWQTAYRFDEIFTNVLCS